MRKLSVSVCLSVRTLTRPCVFVREMSEWWFAEAESYSDVNTLYFWLSTKWILRGDDGRNELGWCDCYFPVMWQKASAIPPGLSHFHLPEWELLFSWFRAFCLNRFLSVYPLSRGDKWTIRSDSTARPRILIKHPFSVRLPILENSPFGRLRED